MNRKQERIFALIIKEFHQIVRDPSSILIAVILPLILLFIYGYGISLDIKHLPLGVQLQDDSPKARSFVETLTNSPYFSVRYYQTEKECERAITAGDIKGFVVVPFYFSEFLMRGTEPAPIFVVADGSEPNTATFTQNYLLGAWSTWQNIEREDRQEKITNSISLEPRYWFNEDVNSKYFLIPGSIAIIMTLTGTILTTLVIAREWERGTMEALMTTPMKMGELIISKVIAYFILGMGSMVLCTFLAIFLFGVPFQGSFLVLALVSTFFLFSALGTGLLISALSRNQFVAWQLALPIAFLPAFMLSGFVFEIASMPEWIQLITYLIPARYFVSSLQTLFLAGTVWKVHLEHLLLLGAYAFLLFTIMRFSVKKRLD